MKKNLLFVMALMVMVFSMAMFTTGCGDDDDEDTDTDGDEDGDTDDDDDTTDDDDDTTDDDDDTAAGCTTDDECTGNLEACQDDGSCLIECTDKTNAQCPAAEFAISVYDDGDGCAAVPCATDEDCAGIGLCDDPANEAAAFNCTADSICDRT